MFLNVSSLARHGMSHCSFNLSVFDKLSPDFWGQHFKKFRNGDSRGKIGVEDLWRRRCLCPEEPSFLGSSKLSRERAVAMKYDWKLS
jgi:hypothetical protein